MAVVEYGTVAIVPRGDWEPDVSYDVGNLVSKDGSSYVAHKKPPIGNLPTDTNYWQVSSQGTSKATETSLGTMKPDGITTTIDEGGAISAKKATTSSAGIVRPSETDFTVGEDATQKINTEFTQAVTLANIIAGEAISSIWGKVAKSIATTMNLDQTALLESMLTSQQVDDESKIPTAALVFAMQQTIERLNTEKISTSKIVNNFLSSDATAVAAAPTVKNLDERVTQLNGDLSAIGENQDDYTQWVREKYYGIPDRSVKVLYNTSGANEALYIFCRNNSKSGLVIRFNRDTALSIQKMVFHSTGSSDWITS